MHRINHITSGMDAELQALLDLHAAQTFKEFWRAARRVIHSALPVGTTWFAPASDWLLPTAAFRAEMPFQAELEFRRFQERHPLGAFLRANPKKALARLSDHLPDLDLRKSDFHREFMAPQRDRFCVVMSFWQGTTLQALLGVHRLEEHGDFSRAELRILGELQRHLAAALQRVCGLQRERSAHRALELLLAPLPLPTAVVDWELEVRYCNDAAKQMAALWKTGREVARCMKNNDRFELPSEIREHCCRLKAAWTTPGPRGRRAAVNRNGTLRHSSLPGMQVAVRLMHRDAATLGMPHFAIVFEDLRGLGSVRLPETEQHLSHFEHLSVREREVALLVCKGESNKEIAAELGKSVLTVKAQLQSIFGKLGVPGRSRLTSLLRT